MNEAEWKKACDEKMELANKLLAEIFEGADYMLIAGVEADDGGGTDLMSAVSMNERTAANFASAGVTATISVVQHHMKNCPCKWGLNTLARLQVARTALRTATKEADAEPALH